MMTTQATTGRWHLLDHWGTQGTDLPPHEDVLTTDELIGYLDAIRRDLGIQQTTVLDELIGAIRTRRPGRAMVLADQLDITLTFTMDGES